MCACFQILLSFIIFLKDSPNIQDMAKYWPLSLMLGWFFFITFYGGLPEVWHWQMANQIKKKSCTEVKHEAWSFRIKF